MKSSFERLAIGFQLLWRERWNVVMGSGLFAVAVLLMMLIEK